VFSKIRFVRFGPQCAAPSEDRAAELNKGRAPAGGLTLGEWMNIWPGHEDPRFRSVPSAATQQPCLLNLRTPAEVGDLAAQCGNARCMRPWRGSSGGGSATPRRREPVQEVMLRIHRHAGEMNPLEHLAASVHQVARPAVVDVCRRRAARPELPAGSGVDIALPQPPLPALDSTPSNAGGRHQGHAGARSELPGGRRRRLQRLQAVRHAAADVSGDPTERWPTTRRCATSS
jgi:hypothetical protein